VIGTDYIKIMRILTEMESEYVEKVRTSNYDARTYYLNGAQSLRVAKAKIKQKYEEENSRKPGPAKKWYHFWSDNF
jgi:hypothetical protein